MSYWMIVGLAFIAPLLTALPHQSLRGYGREYWHLWREWLPAKLVGAFVLALFGVFNTASEWWYFNPERVGGPQLWGIPLAEWFFFIGAAFAFRFLEWLADRLAGAIKRRWGYDLNVPVRNPGRVLLPTALLAGAGIVVALYNNQHARTVFEFGPMLLVMLLIGLSTGLLRQRLFWAFKLPLAVIVLLIMDNIMNAIDSFWHQGERTGVMVAFIPLEDLAFILYVATWMFSVRYLWQLIVANMWRNPSLGTRR